MLVLFLALTLLCMQESFADPDRDDGSDKHSGLGHIRVQLRRQERDSRNRGDDGSDRKDDDEEKDRRPGGKQ